MKVSTPKPEAKVIVARMVLRGDQLAVTVRGSDDPAEVSETLMAASALVSSQGKPDVNSAQQGLGV